jgi:zinc protease
MILALASTLAASPPPARGAIRVVEQPSPRQPLVALRLVFQAGSADDPRGYEGATYLTAAMLAEGSTQKRTYAQVLDAFYPMAAGIQSYVDKDLIVFEGTVHRDNLDAFAELLADQLLLPRFSAEDFTRTKQDTLDALTKTLRGNDDENLGKQVLATMMYAGHPYGHPALGTEAGLTACTRQTIQETYARLFTQDRLIIGLAGGYPPAFKERFLRRFASLPASGAPRRALPPPASPEGIRIQWVDKPALGTAISLGHPLSITRADDDFYPLFLAASYLGEHRTFNGVLMLNMRQKRGLNYGDYAYVENFIQDDPTTFPLPNIARRQQHFEIWIRPVAPQNTGFAIRQAIYELDKLIREGIPADGLEATRAFLMNYLNLWAQDPSRRLGYAIDALLYGKDILAELRRRLPTLTKAEVDQAIRAHLSVPRLSIAVVGKFAANLRDALVQGRPTPMVYDTPDTPPAMLEEDRIIERFPLPLLDKQPKILSAKHLFQK